MVDRFQIEREGNGLLFVGLATCERFADWTDNGALTTIMRIVVVANTVTTDEIRLIFHRPCSCQDLPGTLTALRPVSHNDDGIELEAVRITAPDGKT